MKQRIWITTCGMALLGFIIYAQQSNPKEKSMKPESSVPENKKEVVTKTEEEWKKQLTPEQYRVLRESGTERPHGEEYQKFKKQGGGTYYCVGCGTELFSSEHKFDAHCGWPAFYDASNNDNLLLIRDLSHGMVRTEVQCAKCKGHLGHLFMGEGFETPKDQRYCINGVTLKFVPHADENAAANENKK